MEPENDPGNHSDINVSLPIVHAAHHFVAHPSSPAWQPWIEKLKTGDRRSLARLITAVENDSETRPDILAALYPQGGRAWVLGVTGAPGTGKSTLVNALAKHYRTQEQTVAILAIDPTSPFSGGALLGDRVRMRDLSGDPGIFIRSMATRGALGGLARATTDALVVLDAAGFDWLIVETVGVGQAEVEIARTADTTVVVEAPGLGDEVQAIKAGLLEIADLFAVNKADREGVDRTVSALQMMLSLGANRPIAAGHHGVRVSEGRRTKDERRTKESEEWTTPIIKTVATQGEGVEALAHAIESHKEYLLRSGERHACARQRAEAEVMALLTQQLMARFLADGGGANLDALIEQVAARQRDPYAAVAALLPNESPKRQ